MVWECACFSRSNAVVSEKSPFYFSWACTERLVLHVGRLVACSARMDTQTHRPTTVTLAAHVRRGLITCATCICVVPFPTASQLPSGSVQTSAHPANPATSANSSSSHSYTHLSSPLTRMSESSSVYISSLPPSFLPLPPPQSSLTTTLFNCR